MTQEYENRIAEIKDKIEFIRLERELIQEELEMRRLHQLREFNPNEHLMQIGKGDNAKDYLPVNWRLVWFRLMYPNGTITTELVHIDREQEFQVEETVWVSGQKKKITVIRKGIATCRAIITNGCGGIGIGTKTEDAGAFPDFLEKAETGAKGRALADLGFGTQFAPELSEGEDVVDSPVKRKPNENNKGNATAQPVEKISEKQIGTITGYRNHLSLPVNEQEMKNLSYEEAKEEIKKLHKLYEEFENKKKSVEAEQPSEAPIEVKITKPQPEEKPATPQSTDPTPIIYASFSPEEKLVFDRTYDQSTGRKIIEDHKLPENVTDWTKKHVDLYFEETKKMFVDQATIAGMEAATIFYKDKKGGVDAILALQKRMKINGGDMTQNTLWSAILYRDILENINTHFYHDLNFYVDPQHRLLAELGFSHVLDIYGRSKTAELKEAFHKKIVPEYRKDINIVPENVKKKYYQFGTLDKKKVS